MKNITLQLKFDKEENMKQVESLISVNSDIIDMSRLGINTIKEFSEQFLLDFSDLLDIDGNLEQLLLLWEKQGYKRLLSVWIPFYENKKGVVWNSGYKNRLFIYSIINHDRVGAQFIAKNQEVDVKQSVSDNMDLFYENRSLKSSIFDLFERAIKAMQLLGKFSDNDPDFIIPADESVNKKVCDIFFRYHDENSAFTSKELRKLLGLSLMTSDKYVYNGLMERLKARIKNRDIITESTFNYFFEKSYLTALSKEFARLEKENYIRIMRWKSFGVPMGQRDNRVKFMELLKKEVG